MSKRHFGIYQTVSDVRNTIGELASKWAGLKLLSAESGTRVPADLSRDDIRGGKVFLISAERFMCNLEFSTLPDGRRYVDTLNSSVISVRPSRTTDTSLESGVYLLTSTRVVTADSVKLLVKKEAEFLNWGDQLFRFVKSRATRRESYPGYKDWFLPEAASWIDATPGHWETTGTYVADQIVAD